jgi:hypothetical protein
MQRRNISGIERELNKGKICFIFFRLKDSLCPACQQFRPIFKQLCSDNELTKKISFVEYLFGEDPNTKIIYDIKKEYKEYIENVPHFLMHFPNGKIANLLSGPPGRDFDSMKFVLLDAITRYS